MLDHGRILDWDPYGYVQGRWLNIYWLFQCVVALLYRAGGFELLVVMKSLLAASAMLAFGLALRRRVGPAWLTFCGLAALMLMAWRIRVRPEAFTLAFLMLVVVLTDGVRLGGSPRRLWWLVPVMAAWVNMHGLYVVGLAAMWTALAGAWLDRFRGRPSNLCGLSALVPALAATAACLLSPWPIDANMHFTMLFTRIADQGHYNPASAECQPIWQAMDVFPDAIAIALFTLFFMVMNRRRLPVGHVLWFVAFTILAAMAVRNIALLGPICGWLLAINGWPVVEKLVGLRRLWGRLAPFVLPLLVLAALGAIAVSITGMHDFGGAYRFGVGLDRDEYPLRSARYLRDLNEPGDVFCMDFGDSAPILYYAAHGLDRANRRLWIDSRLEAYSDEHFATYRRIVDALADAKQAQTVELPPDVRFIFAGQRGKSQLAAMKQVSRFKFILDEPAGTLFERTDWPGRPLPPG